MQAIRAFATTLLVHEFKDSRALNGALKRAILAKERESHGMKRSNGNACWHSGVDLLHWPHPCMTDLHERIKLVSASMVKAHAEKPDDFDGKQYGMSADAWAMVSRNEDYGFMHNHPNAFFSGVYYVATGRKDKRRKNGVLEFMDPRIHALHVPGLTTTDQRAIEPKPGLCVMFPGWLMHSVHPFHGTGERIAVAFNVQVKRLKR